MSLPSGESRIKNVSGAGRVVGWRDVVAVGSGVGDRREGGHRGTMTKPVSQHFLSRNRHLCNSMSFRFECALQSFSSSHLPRYIRLIQAGDIYAFNSNIVGKSPNCLIFHATKTHKFLKGTILYLIFALARITTERKLESGPLTVNTTKHHQNTHKDTII